jgi:uncharacterized protein (DUF1330 family)
MPGYFIVQSTIKDEAQYQKYVRAVVPFIASFGGKLVARRAKVEVLEGEHDERPVAMFVFPNMEAIHAAWNSPDYVPIKKLREGIATLNIWAFAGSDRFGSEAVNVQVHKPHGSPPHARPAEVAE